MKIASTNTSNPVKISWKGSEQVTGIYKTPQQAGIFLTREGVRGDTIGNPKVHGGTEKACYLFSLDQYPYWQRKYPGLNWEYGMFGENLTVEAMDETQMHMGSVYQLGKATVRITTPREPCYKLGIRFGDQGIIEEFVKHGYPGAYISVIEPGYIQPGDPLTLLDASDAELSIAAYFRLLYAGEKDKELIDKALSLSWLSDQKKNQLLRWKT
jgi:MOSC domain-containing protein YiiM